MHQLKMYHLMDNIPDIAVPEGFTVRKYRQGEEMDWVRICKNGLLGKNATITDWNNAILGMSTLDPERDVVFVCDINDYPVATIAAFIHEDGNGDIHMVASEQNVRGHGIGAFMLSYAMKQLKERMEPGHYTHLTTDDWRLPAIVGYLRGGFHPVLYDVKMQERWSKVCREVNIHGIEMLDDSAGRTGIIL